MNLDNLTGKVTKNADTLAMIYGLIADPIGAGRGIEGGIDFMISRLAHWKVPDFWKILEALFYMPGTPYTDNMKTAIYAYLAGEGLKLVGQSKYGNIAKKAGTGLAKGTAAAAFLWLPAINPSLNMNKYTSGTQTIATASYADEY